MIDGSLRTSLNHDPRQLASLLDNVEIKTVMMQRYGAVVLLDDCQKKVIQKLKGCRFEGWSVLALEKRFV